MTGTLPPIEAAGKLNLNDGYTYCTPQCRLVLLQTYKHMANTTKKLVEVVLTAAHVTPDD